MEVYYNYEAIVHWLTVYDFDPVNKRTVAEIRFVLHVDLQNYIKTVYDPSLHYREANLDVQLTADELNNNQLGMFVF